MYKKTFFIETLGCQMNKADSEKISGILETLGYNEVTSPEDALLLIMNTCSIRAMSENKAFSHLGVWKKFKRKNPDIKIAICGCIAQQTKEKIFHRAPQVDLIFGTHNIYELPQLLEKLEKQPKICSVLKTPFDSEKSFAPSRKKGLSAWLPIIEGCDYFCAYCVVPYTRGRQRSRMPEDIIKEARQIASEGFKEIILLGQTVDSYGNDIADDNINLSNLLKQLDKIDGILRISFVTSHPADITDELIYTVRDTEKVCEFFHLPMQSGSTEVLKRMKRPYSREQYLNLVSKIQTAMPDVVITSDFIAGFPGETDEQFMETVSIIKEVVFDHCNTAAYSPRKQTPAAVWKDQVPQEEKKRRLNILNKLVRETVKKSHERFIGKTLEVLVEDFKEENGEIILTGKTRGAKVTHFKGDSSLIGSLVQVKIKDASIWSLIGEAVYT
ncbi:MAG TPA: tRNA (N6-isopentenyl adenosine(37)-C2)-methylthiotransferase MiaB [Candidatus Gastranaerophilales bacterium]|nr:tRNA (N6-isopentenyl adenosine(37)-C2)-methylthiotransferase MiaB [Candidatus Gastranaerophilales bacterium]